ncbi:MAG: CvpA family protein, partial [Bacteroidales bacterium]|nr:CvpA family protein [Bacteroidales bacterium]
GLIRGFIRQIAAILGFIVGLIAAKSLYMYLADYLHPYITHSLTAAQVIAFIAIWIAVPLLFALIGSLLTRGFTAMALGGLNRLLGFLLGGLKYFLLMSLCVGVFEYIDSNNNLISETNKRASVLYYPMNNLTGIFLPVAKEAYNYIITE